MDPNNTQAPAPQAPAQPPVEPQQPLAPTPVADVPPQTAPETPAPQAPVSTPLDTAAPVKKGMPSKVVLTVALVVVLVLAAVSYFFLF